MALVLKDRVRVTSSTTGTGTFTLGSAAAGFQDFSVIGDGNTTYYTIQNSGDNTWEVGIGTYTASGTTLSRDTVLESSNSGSLVNFAAGTKDVFVTYPAEKGLYLDASNNAIGLGTPASATLTNATGLPISTGVSGLGSGVATFLGTPSSSNLASAVTDETGSGSLVFATSPTLVTPALGTPSSGTLTSCTGLPLTTGVTGTLPVTNGGTGTATSFTTGSVVFAGASGVYSQDNANLFWDDTNNRLGIGTASPASTLDIGSGNLNFSGTAQRITGDFSNATAANRVIFQTSTPNSATGVNFMPNGTGTSSNIIVNNNSDLTNASRFRMGVDASQAVLTADRNGTGTYLPITFSTNAAERMRIDTSGNVGIGVTPVGTGLLELKAGTATVAPLEFNSGTNLTTPVAGVVEYDGTIMTATSNTNFKRGTIPLTNYASGTGTTLGTNTEATLAALLPAANDTITLSIGTYFIDTSFIITRGASTTSATARLNILGAGTAAGNFSGMSISAPTSGGATANFSFDAVNINVSNVLTTASTTSGGVYQISLQGILKVTTSGTIIPQYNLSANINGAGTVSKVWYFRLQQLDTQSAAAFGPAGTGWA